MSHVFHLPENPSFEKVGIRGKIFDTRSVSEEVEFTVVETEAGHQTRIREQACLFSYFILEGAGSFEIGDVTENCSAGDLVIVPRGVAFQYAGRMRMLLVSAPWWFPEQEETL